MMKRMTGVALCALLGGCVIAVGSSDAGPLRAVETKRFEVSGFDAVDLAGSDDVRVVRSDRVSVVASGDPRAVAALSVTVDHGTLRIARKPGRWQDRGAMVTVTVPSLRAATLSGSGDLTLRDVRNEAVRIDIAGSGDIVASGNAGRVDIRVGGSGDVNARALYARDLRVDLAGSGDVDAQASGTADITANGSGDVSVTGTARCTVRKGGSGDVRCG